MSDFFVEGANKSDMMRIGGSLFVLVSLVSLMEVLDGVRRGVLGDTVGGVVVVQL